jgi:hypothetical protein
MCSFRLPPVISFLLGPNIPLSTLDHSSILSISWRPVRCPEFVYPKCGGRWKPRDHIYMKPIGNLRGALNSLFLSVNKSWR